MGVFAIGGMQANGEDHEAPPRQTTPHKWLDSWCSNTNGAIVARLSGAWSFLLLDTDAALTADSDTRVPSQKAVRSYVAAYIAAQDVEIFKGAIDCSTNPNYPAADAGHVYRVSVAGKIGGASGVNVEVNDRLECIVDSSAGGDHAMVGANWMISQVNIDGAVTGPAASASGNLPTFSGTSGKIIQDSGKSVDTDGALTANSDDRLPTQKAVRSYVDSVTGADIAVDLELALGQLALQAADNAGAALFLGIGGNRFADSFDALAYVDTGGASNLDSSAAGLLKPTAAVSDSLAAQTLNGDSAGWAGYGIRIRVAAASISTSGGKCRITVLPPSAGASLVLAAVYIGHKAAAGNAWDFAASPAKAQVTFSGGNAGVTLVAGGAAVVSDLISFALDETKDVIVAFDVTTGDVRRNTGMSSDFNFYAKSGGAGEASSNTPSGYTGTANRLDILSRIQVQTGVNDVTVSSTSLTAVSGPSSARLVAHIKEIDSIALNTDLVFSVSRDGGTTWTAFTMHDRFTSPSPTAGVHVLESDVLDISGQPSGTSMKWKAATANGKMVEIHDVYLHWN